MPGLTSQPPGGLGSTRSRINPSWAPYGYHFNSISNKAVLSKLNFLKNDVKGKLVNKLLSGDNVIIKPFAVTIGKFGQPKNGLKLILVL